MGFKESLIAAYRQEAERHPERREAIEAKLKDLDAPVSAVEVEQRKQARTGGKRVERATNPPGGRKAPASAREGEKE